MSMLGKKCKRCKAAESYWAFTLSKDDILNDDSGTAAV